MRTHKAGNNQSKMSSKWLQDLEEGSSVLYEAIHKNLKKQLCGEHNQNVQYFYNQRLLCPSCFQRELSKMGRVLAGEQQLKYRYLYHLKRIINYPIILLADQQSLFQYPIHIIQLLLKSYQPLYSKNNDFNIQKELLNAFITRVKHKINLLCDQLLASFEKAEEFLSNIRVRRDQMKDISKMYEQHFIDLLQQKYVQGTRNEFQEVLRDFTNNNVNPFDKIYSNLDEVMSYMAQSPVLNIQHMKQLYTTITDQSLWNINNIVTTKNQQGKQINNQLIIMNNSQIPLQSEYDLQVTQDSITLLKEDREIGKLNVAFDSLYHYSKYRLIGVNYDSIQVISYFDRLNVDSVHQIQGCTDLLSFEHYIVAISNQNLVKIDLLQQTHTILGEDFSELQYISKEHSKFSCIDSKDQRIQWNLLLNTSKEVY